MGETVSETVTWLPSFAYPLGLVLLDAFAGADALQDFGFVVLLFWWEQDAGGLSDDFCGGVAVEAFCAGVPAGDASVEGLAHDRVVRRLHDRRQLGLRMVRVTTKAAARRDVLDAVHDQLRPMLVRRGDDVLAGGGLDDRVASIAE